MKRTISLLLSLVMLLSVTTGINFAAYAGEVISISLSLPNPIELIENDEGEYMIDSNGNRYFNYDVNDYYTPYFRQKGSTFTVTTNEGSTTYTYKQLYEEYGEDFYWGWYDADGNELDGRWFETDPEEDQKDNHWSVGTNYLTIYYKNATTQIPVTVVKGSEILSISYIPANPIVLNEYEDGDFKSVNGKMMFVYSYYFYNDGDKLVITTDNGVIEYTYYDYYASGVYGVFVDVDGNRLYWKNKPEFSDDQLNNPWGCGVNYITVSFKGYTSQIPVEVLKTHDHSPKGSVRENIVDATCSKEGSYDEVVYCKDCGFEMSREKKFIAKLAHNWDVGKTTVQPSFVVGGSKIYTCTACGETKTESIARLGSTKLTKLKKGKKSFTAQWSKANGVDGYQIQYGLKKNFKKATTKYSKGTKLTAKKLKSKKTYYVRVRAYKKINGKNYYSAWSTKKVKVK